MYGVELIISCYITDRQLGIVPLTASCPCTISHFCHLAWFLPAQPSLAGSIEGIGPCGADKGGERGGWHTKRRLPE